MSSEQDERREMVHDFVTESREMLDDIEPQILALEKHASQSGDIDDEILNTIFRLFHSLVQTSFSTFLVKVQLEKIIMQWFFVTIR